MTSLPFDVVTAILLIPICSAGLLALLPGYRLSARLNVLASLLTLLAALLLFTDRPEANQYVFVDDLNIVFIVLNSFVGFTTSVFSASYIAHELATGRLTPTYLRFYHAIYQVMMFGMNLALLSNNLGLMWVAVELATLSTVIMVGIYRTHEALEAAGAWLATTQKGNGSFGGGGLTEPPNTNSTGLAGTALGELGQCDQAQSAARWVKKLQVRKGERSKLRGEQGAIAYDADARDLGREQGIKKKTEYQWRLATAQAAR